MNFYIYKLCSLNPINAVARDKSIKMLFLDLLKPHFVMKTISNALQLSLYREGELRNLSCFLKSCQPSIFCILFFFFFLFILLLLSRQKQHDELKEEEKKPNFWFHDCSKNFSTNGFSRVLVVMDIKSIVCMHTLLPKQKFIFKFQRYSRIK